MTTYTDEQLKRALAKMLPDQIHTDTVNLFWNAECDIEIARVLDTELLHLCSLVENGLTDGQYDTFEQELAKVVDFKCGDEWPATSSLRLVISATWQQRVIAMCRVKGVEIV